MAPLISQLVIWKYCYKILWSSLNLGQLYDEGSYPIYYGQEKEKWKFLLLTEQEWRTLAVPCIVFSDNPQLNLRKLLKGN